jgi:hypothetical protein
MPNLLVFWYPLHIRIWGQVGRAVNAQRRWQAFAWALGEGLALWGTVMMDLQYLFYIAFLMGPFALLTLVESRARARLIGWGVVALVIFMALMWWSDRCSRCWNSTPKAFAVSTDAWSIPFPDDSDLGLPMGRRGVGAQPADIRQRDHRDRRGGAVAAVGVASDGAGLVCCRGRISRWTHTHTTPYKPIHEAMEGIFRSLTVGGGVCVLAVVLRGAPGRLPSGGRAPLWVGIDCCWLCSVTTFSDRRYNPRRRPTSFTE